MLVSLIAVEILLAIQENGIGLFAILFIPFTGLPPRISGLGELVFICSHQNDGILSLSSRRLLHIGLTAI